MSVNSIHNFAACYMEKCRQRRLRPLPVICVTVPYSLNIPMDRIKCTDWEPIQNSLSQDRSLKSISIRSRYPYRKQPGEVNSRSNVRSLGKVPAILTNDILEGLFQSLSQCVRHSLVLINLELEGIPIPRESLVMLGAGLSATRSLQHLSFQKCHFGDSGCDVICHSILYVRTIQTLNLSQCDLTSKSGSSIAAVLLRQKLLLFHDAWKGSLRYRDPNLDSMQGMRRLTLTGNKYFGDPGVREIFEAIRDSLWIKALDLQDCGLTDGLSKEILDVLDNNTSLVILDVAANADLSDANMSEINKKLEDNRANNKSDLRYLSFTGKSVSQEKLPTFVKNNNNNFKKCKKEVMNKALTRSKTFIPRTNTEPVVKTRVQAREMHFSRSTYQPPNRSKMKPQTAPPNGWRQRQLQEKSHVPDIPQLTQHPKASLHLDLQSQIRPVADSTQNDGMIREEPATVQSANRGEEINNMSIKMKDTICQLTEIRIEREQLMEEVKRNDLLLAEERARREMAEENLHATKCELAELEKVLREKEKETNGYVLVSQKSLDEIYDSYDHLLEVLDTTSKQPSMTQIRLDEEVLSKEDIRRHLAFLLRKTQSENLQRGGGEEPEGHTSKRITVKKIARKSEGDIHSVLSPTTPIHLERHMGDTIDRVSARMGMDILEHLEDPRIKYAESPRTRAREIFARIINGEAIVNLNNRVG